MVRRADHQEAQALRTPIGHRAEQRHPRVDRDLEREHPTIRVDLDRRSDPRLDRPLLHTNKPDRTLAPAAQPKDRKQERREEDLDADNDERRGQYGEALLGEFAEAAIDPVGDDESADHKSRKRDPAPEK
jgi:hypothetical protein